MNYCRDCSLYKCGSDSRDFANLGQSVVVDCYCCSLIEVDHNGSRTTLPHNGCKCKENRYDSLDRSSANHRSNKLNGNTD